MLLYIHVPFCRKKCAYCGFFSLPLPTGRAGADLVKDYLAALLQEMRFKAPALKGAALNSVYFGGGTPSLLPGKALKGLLTEICKLFTLAKNAEISAEANPDSALADGWLFEARQAGVNRLSLGVQSLHDHDLKILGRAHDARTAEAAFATARAAGFSNISLDFMWGLPGTERGQSQRQWLMQLQNAVNLKPEHLSAYGLSLEPQSALEEAVAAGRLIPPAEREQASMYLAGAEFLESRGYMQYEISNFARMGFACRHNLGYWQGEEYLGLGPSAVSTLSGRRCSNPADMSAWTRAVEQRQYGEIEELDNLTRLKERLMLSLRTSRGLVLKDWQKHGGRPFLASYAAMTALLQQKGLATTRNGRFRLTREGMLVSDAILARLLEEVEKKEG